MGIHLDSYSVSGDACACPDVYVFWQCFDPLCHRFFKQPGRPSVVRCRANCPPCRKFSLEMVPNKLVVVAYPRSPDVGCNYLPELVDCEGTTVSDTCQATITSGNGDGGTNTGGSNGGGSNNGGNSGGNNTDGESNGGGSNSGGNNNGGGNNGGDGNESEIVPNPPAPTTTKTGGDEGGIPLWLIFVIVFGSLGLVIFGIAAYYLYEYRQYRHYLQSSVEGQEEEDFSYR